MALAFGFNHEAAIRSFERAQQLDPKAPMPFWGEAWALGTNYNMPVDDAREKLAFEKITTAKSLAADGAQAERDYIDAMAMRYTSDMKADRAALERKYSAAMGELSRKYPDDLDAATLYAESMMNLNPWKLWTADGKPAPGTPQIVAVLESVLRRDPNHMGANHFYIHAVEAVDPARALPMAERLAGLMPGAGHLVHMPGHIYVRVGRYVDAIRANEHAVHADESYISDQKPGAGTYTLGGTVGNSPMNAVFAGGGKSYPITLRASRPPADLAGTWVLTSTTGAAAPAGLLDTIITNADGRAWRHREVDYEFGSLAMWSRRDNYLVLDQSGGIILKDSLLIGSTELQRTEVVSGGATRTEHYTRVSTSAELP